MALRAFLSLATLAVFFSVAPVRGVDVTTVDDVAHADWKGIILYLKVDKAAVQAKLDEFSDEGGPRLELPTSPPFPDILNSEQHVVMLGIGHVRETDFDGYDDPQILSRWDEIGVTVPYLTDEVNWIPHYALTLGELHEETNLQVANPDFAFPDISVERLTITDGDVGGAYWGKVELDWGVDRMVLNVTHHPDGCGGGETIVRHEFEDDINNVKQIGAQHPQFGICDEFPEYRDDPQNTFCRTVLGHESEVETEGPNFCQTWWHSAHAEQCRVQVEVVEMTGKVRELFLLPEEGPVEFVAQLTNVGNFTIGLEYPCVVQ